jgi:hypothetical protein
MQIYQSRWTHHRTITNSRGFPHEPPAPLTQPHKIQSKPLTNRCVASAALSGSATQHSHISCNQILSFLEPFPIAPSSRTTLKTGSTHQQAVRKESLTFAIPTQSKKCESAADAVERVKEESVVNIVQQTAVLAPKQGSHSHS